MGVILAQEDPRPPRFRQTTGLLHYGMELVFGPRKKKWCNWQLKVQPQGSLATEQLFPFLEMKIYKYYFHIQNSVVFKNRLGPVFVVFNDTEMVGVFFFSVVGTAPVDM